MCMTRGCNCKYSPKSRFGCVAHFMVFIVMAFLALNSGGIVAAKRMQPKWSNISPVSGFKRVLSIGACGVFKSLIKVGIVAQLVTSF